MGNRRGPGVILVAISALAFSLNGLCAHVSMDQGFPSFQVVFSRSIIQTAGTGLWALYKCNDFTPSTSVWLLMILRGFVDSSAISLLYYCFSRLNLGDANVLFFTSPVLVGPIAYFWLGEMWGKLDLVASAICMAGVILVSRPPFMFKSEGSEDAPLETVPTILGLVAAFMASHTYIVVRKIGGDATIFVQVFWNGCVALLSSLVIMFAFQSPKLPETLSHFLLLASLGATAIVGQLLFSRGLQLLEAGPSSLVRTLDIVFAYSWGALFLDEQPTVLTLIGAFVIVSSIVFISVVRAMRVNRSRLEERESLLTQPLVVNEGTTPTPRMWYDGSAPECGGEQRGEEAS